MRLRVFHPTKRIETTPKLVEKLLGTRPGHTTTTRAGCDRAVERQEPQTDDDLTQRESATARVIEPPTVAVVNAVKAGKVGLHCFRVLTAQPEKADYSGELNPYRSATASTISP